MDEPLDKPSNEDSKQKGYFASKAFACRRCHKIFSSSNQLHNHVFDQGHELAIPEEPTARNLIEFSLPEPASLTEGLLSYSETRVRYALTPNSAATYELVADTGFGSSAVGKQALERIEKVQKVVRVPLKHERIIHGIRGLSRLNELVKFHVFLKAKGNRTIKMPINAFVLEEIGTDILVGNDIIIAYQIVLDNSKRRILLLGKDNANIVVDTIIQEKKRVKLLPVRAKDTCEIPAGSH